MAVHGITEDMVADQPTEEEVMPKILEFIGDYPIVAHNCIFDYSYLNEASIRTTGKPLENVRIDTQHMFKEIYPEVTGVSVACKGGDSPEIQAKLIAVISTSLNVGSNRICIVGIK